MKRSSLLIHTAILCLVFLSTMSFNLANCIPGKSFTNFNTIENPGAYYYIHFGDVTINATDLVARFWQTDNRGAANEDMYDDSLWLLDSPYFPATDQWYLNGHLGAAGVRGCPLDSLTLVIEDQKNGQFVAMAVLEDLPRSVEYDYSKLGTDMQAIAIPQPQLSNVTFVGPEAIFDLTVNDASDGIYNLDTGDGADITQVIIYQAINPSSMAIVASDWQQIGSTTNGGSAFGLVADCLDPGDQPAIAVGMEINGVPPTIVGVASFIDCSFDQDFDGDGIKDGVDNCREIPNINQSDMDNDLLGDVCDNCEDKSNSSQLDSDGDALGDVCDECPMDAENDQDADDVCESMDNCPLTPNVNQLDDDADTLGNACDNCRMVSNRTQSDFDGDLIGDHCDLDDGMIYIICPQVGTVDWQEETGFSSWVAYRGDMDTLRATGVYTQSLGSNPSAGRQCGLELSEWLDSEIPSSGKTAYYLVTGISGAGESSLGDDSEGLERPNTDSCP